MYSRAFAILLVAGCASTTAPPQPAPPSGPGPQRTDRAPLLSVEVRAVSEAQFAEVAAGVERAMQHAHGVARTTPSFVIPNVDEVVGQVGWSSREILFAVNDDVIGTVPRQRPCGAGALQLGWRALPVGREWGGTQLDSQPQWWRVGDGWVRVGATELVGVAIDARPDGECDIWGVLVEGPARADAEVKFPGESGPTEGGTANVFGVDSPLVVAPAGVVVGEVTLKPTFEATCVHTRWAADLLGTRTLRARFSNGPQSDGCTTGDVYEEFAHSRGPNGEVSRTQRTYRTATGTQRDDYVVRTVGAGRLVWEGSSSTSSSAADGCETVVEAITGRWTFKHPTQPDRAAEGRRTRTDRNCGEGYEAQSSVVVQDDSPSPHGG